MTARNDITGDAIKTKGQSEAYRSGWERIFGQKKPMEEPAPAQVTAKPSAPLTDVSTMPMVER